MELIRIISPTTHPKLGKTCIRTVSHAGIESLLAMLRARTYENTFFLNSTHRDEIYGICRYNSPWLNWLPLKLIGIPEFKNVRRWHIGEPRVYDFIHIIDSRHVPAAFCEVEHRTWHSNRVYRYFQSSYTFTM